MASLRRSLCLLSTQSRLFTRLRYRTGSSSGPRWARRAPDQVHPVAPLRATRLIETRPGWDRHWDRCLAPLTRQTNDPVGKVAAFRRTMGSKIATAVRHQPEPNSRRTLGHTRPTPSRSAGAAPCVRDAFQPFRKPKEARGSFPPIPAIKTDLHLLSQSLQNGRQRALRVRTSDMPRNDRKRPLRVSWRPHRPSKHRDPPSRF